MNEHEAVILVVDDYPELLDLMKLTLESAGYQALTVWDGSEALEVLRSQPVDLILADIAMPGMNGYQLYEQVRENPDWVLIPFIFLTARSMDSDIRYGKELGVDDYLTKPIQPKDLLAVIQGKLRRARQLSEEIAPWEPPAETTQQAQASPTRLSLGRLQIEPGQHRVWLDDEPVILSAREFVLLEYMARRVNQILPPPQLIKITHQIDVDADEAGNLLRPLIRSLRRKLGYPTGQMGCIETIRSVGYRLTPP
jgi:DNA-binding response OmpR family regulator